MTSDCPLTLDRLFKGITVVVFAAWRYDTCVISFVRLVLVQQMSYVPA